VPRYVDHDERRTAVADAICRLIAREGIERVTFRNIAAETGLPVGVLNHFFTDKDDLFAFTLQLVSDRSLATLEHDEMSSFDDLLDLLCASVPTTRLSRDSAMVWVSLWGRTIAHPHFATAMRRCESEWRRAFAALLAEAVSRRILVPRADTLAALQSLTVVIDGLNFQAVLSPRRWPAPRVRDELARHLEPLRHRPRPRE
jgi:DNA-binding transcriptional regulator YbjK